MISFQDFLQQSPISFALQGQNSIYVQPNIPYKKILGAQHYLPQHIQRDQILLLLDDTVFGSAKIGLCLTNEGLYFKQDFEDVMFYRFDQIQTITSDTGFMTRSLILNRHVTISLTQPESEGVQLLCQLIDQFIQQNRAPQQNSFNQRNSQQTHSNQVSPALQSATQLLVYLTHKSSSFLDHDDLEFFDKGFRIQGIEGASQYFQQLEDIPQKIPYTQVIKNLSQSEYAYSYDLKAFIIALMLKIFREDNIPQEEMRIMMEDVSGALKLTKQDIVDICSVIDDEYDKRQQQHFNSNHNKQNHYSSSMTSEQQQACQLLGLTEAELNTASLNAAYRSKIAEFHPDKYQQLPDGVKKLIEQQAQQLNEARDLLQRYLM